MLMLTIISLLCLIKAVDCLNRLGVVSTNVAPRSDCNVVIDRNKDVGFAYFDDQGSSNRTLTVAVDNGGELDPDLHYYALGDAKATQVTLVDCAWGLEDAFACVYASQWPATTSLHPIVTSALHVQQFNLARFMSKPLNDFLNRAITKVIGIGLYPVHAVHDLAIIVDAMPGFFVLMTAWSGPTGSVDLHWKEHTQVNRPAGTKFGTREFMVGDPTAVVWIDDAPTPSVRVIVFTEPTDDRAPDAADWVLTTIPPPGQLAELFAAFPFTFADDGSLGLGAVYSFRVKGTTNTGIELVLLRRPPASSPGGAEWGVERIVVTDSLDSSLIQAGTLYARGIQINERTVGIAVAFTIVGGDHQLRWYACSNLGNNNGVCENDSEIDPLDDIVEFFSVDVAMVNEAPVVVYSYKTDILSNVRARVEGPSSEWIGYVNKPQAPTPPTAPSPPPPAVNGTYHTFAVPPVSDDGPATSRHASDPGTAIGLFFLFGSLSVCGGLFFVWYRRKKGSFKRAKIMKA